ncbi:MAG TPA: Na+/H+ antiporter [Candidatus Acidoferrum sp.]|jgi:CPA1 family monovalent cation:H+ antiporter
MSTIHSLELVFLLLLLFVVVFAALARKLNVPYPIVLVIAGLILSVIPGIPKITLDPNFIFLVVLPPLLYAAAWTTSWRDFSYNIVSILFLAFGLVGFTVIGVATAANWSFAPFDFRLGLVLGAVVSTTDAIAATSIAKRIRLPQRAIDILEGESLVNDATGLLALEFAVALIVHNEKPAFATGAFRLLYLIGIGLAIGLVIALIVERVERYLDDGPIEITLSILVPYVAYLAAEEAKASGVLAVVACGLYLSRRSNSLFSPAVRLETFGFWNAFTFLLNGLVFVLIGLQLPFVLAGIRDYSFRDLVLFGVFFSLLVIALRLLWIFPGAYVSNFIRRRIFHQKEPLPSPRAIFVVGWTGMRGVIALAAALSLPLTLGDGSPFPQRNLIIFLTFCVILVTLVLQGLTLPALIRGLGLALPPGIDREEENARRTMLGTALQYIEEQRTADQNSQLTAEFDDLASHYARRLASLTNRDAADPSHDLESQSRLETLSLQLIAIERQTAVRLRNEGHINDEVLRRLERELDLAQTHLVATPIQS